MVCHMTSSRPGITMLGFAQDYHLRSRCSDTWLCHEESNQKLLYDYCWISEKAHFSGCSNLSTIVGRNILDG
ncbi:hypothetical protein RchiOBHm_Chr7g0224671 [Rosa chinensis]|uniref:Uncharacterized protein n=1 Tax=Rosa chinensis TaxID=74649 RepID=A0A2P6PDW9_ROSCH|nr:hypothetical protein RchiOBHm_Chr7g0224671 [Rosa chinensis]